MDAQANGVGSITGSLSAFELIWAQGSSTATGFLAVTINLAGTSSGVATVTGVVHELIWAQGTSTVTGALTVTTGLVDLAGNTNGVATATGILQVPLDTTAGFEIPYLLGLGGVTNISLVSTVAGNSLVIGALHQINQLSATPTGASTTTGALTVTGSQKLAGTTNGVGSLRGELFINAIRNLAGTSNGVATVYVSNTHLIGGLDVDPRSLTYMYLYVNMGVGFNPTDDASALTDFFSQTFPDGHTRDSFWEYLYAFLNIGVGFDPTDDISSRSDFFSQTFPDGHTRDDFWEYLYLYLNVVRGFQQQGQLVIRPGFTRGPILPAKPPKQVPA